MSGNGWKWQEMSRTVGNSQNWLNMAGYGWIWIDMAGYGSIWLEMANNGLTG